ncbi:unnamed protein product [Owenia fusiformis]|uniref:Uncharacterized protein n=1 Tax=Owenia fusiformis TaxID=6347 RepID=A0A8J1TAZ0_OWEFU|nr:unnamed protein product [Owenia fusiformis]
MEYIEVADSVIQPIKEPVKKSYIHVATSNQPITANTMYDYMRELKDSEQEAFVFMNDDANRHGSITFKRWVALSENLAVSLVEMGVKPQDKVGVIIPNCEEIVITIGGLLHCAALPVLLTYDLKSGKDILTKIKDTAINVIVVYVAGRDQQALVEKLFKKILAGNIDQDIPSLNQVIMIADDVPKGAIDFNNLLNEKSDDEKKNMLLCNENISMDDPCWINLTSGSTGKPKYCPLTHKMIINGVKSIAQRCNSQAGDILFNDRPMSWNVGTLAFGQALATQLTVVTIDAKQTVKKPGPEKILRCIAKERITDALLVPYILYDIMNMESKQREEYDISSLVNIMTLGQKVDPTFIENVKSTLGTGVTIMYGSTEAGLISMIFPRGDFRKQHLTIGYGGPHVEISIRDEKNQLVPVNVEGEICARGPNIFLGYLNNEEKTKEVIDEKGWFHTGDIGTLTPYGYVTIVGRIKEFIKRGTVIVHPSAIEHILMENPSIHEVYVVGVPDPRLYEELCACIKLKDGHSLSEIKMKEWCDEIFGDFTADGLKNAPKYFLMLDVIPTLANGKTDRLSLKKMAANRYGQ